MAEVYVRLIMAGKKTVEQVPKKLQKEVKKLLKEAGWENPNA